MGEQLRVNGLKRCEIAGTAANTAALTSLIEAACVNIKAPVVVEKG
jgi:hypothetical protein